MANGRVTTDEFGKVGWSQIIFKFVGPGGKFGFYLFCRQAT